jgi:hypothetical protein
MIVDHTNFAQIDFIIIIMIYSNRFAQASQSNLTFGALASQTQPQQQQSAFGMQSGFGSAFGNNMPSNQQQPNQSGFGFNSNANPSFTQRRK